MSSVHPSSLILDLVWRSGAGKLKRRGWFHTLINGSRVNPRGRAESQLYKKVIKGSKNCIVGRHPAKFAIPQPVDLGEFVGGGVG